MDKGQHWRVDLSVVILLLTTLNLASAYGFDGWEAPVAQISVASVAIMGARHRGYTLAELGLEPGAARAGFRLGALSALVVAVVVTVAASLPFTRGLFEDDRFVDLSTADVAFELGFRIPVVTVLTEELLFRSVLLAVLLVGTSARRAVCVSSALFGLWHVLTTLGDLGANEVTDDLGIVESALSVSAVVAFTAGAGIAFCWLRLRSGSLVAPWLAHTAVNASAFAAGVVLAG